MKVLALVGVSGTGKTTLVSELEQLLGSSKLTVVSEAMRGDILNYSRFPVSFDVKTARQIDALSYDIARVEYQMIWEKKIITSADDDQIVVIDKAVPVHLMYLLSFSQRKIKEQMVTEIIKEVENHIDTYYDIMVHLPFLNFDTSKDNLERNFVNSKLLELQNAALTRVVSWFENKATKTISLGQRNRATQILQLLEQ